MPGAVEQSQQGGAPRPAERRNVPTDRVEQEVLDLLSAGRKIDAIKVYRERTGHGLKESKDAVEHLAAQHGIVPPRGGCVGAALVLLVAIGIVGMILLIAA